MTSVLDSCFFSPGFRWGFQEGWFRSTQWWLSTYRCW